MQKLLNAYEAARLAEKHEDVIRRALRAGELPATKKGNEWQIAIPDLETWAGRPLTGPLSLEERVARLEAAVSDVIAQLAILQGIFSSPIPSSVPIRSSSPYPPAPLSSTQVKSRMGRRRDMRTAHQKYLDYGGKFPHVSAAAQWLDEQHGIKEGTVRHWKEFVFGTERETLLSALRQLQALGRKPKATDVHECADPENPNCPCHKLVPRFLAGEPL